jgi:acetyl esterase/lipase
VALYPGHPYDYDKSELNSDIHVARNTPPTFVLQAENDNVDGVTNSRIYSEALKNADVPAELHLYAGGGHAFGFRRTKFPITAWPRLGIRPNSVSLSSFSTTTSMRACAPTGTSVAAGGEAALRALVPLQ